MLQKKQPGDLLVVHGQEKAVYLGDPGEEWVIPDMVACPESKESTGEREGGREGGREGRREGGREKA